MFNKKIAFIIIILLFIGAITIFFISLNIDNNSDKGVAKIGDCVDVNYIARFADNNTIFETSYKNVAIDEGLYEESGTYQPLKIFIDPSGKLQLPKGYNEYSSSRTQLFLEGLIGMKEGETKTLTIPAEGYYGIWNQSLAESYGLNPYPIEQQVDIIWTMEKSLFSNYFAIGNIINNTTFDWGYVSLGITDFINATIIDIGPNNVTFEINVIDGISYKDPLYNWNVTILKNNDKTFLMKTSADKGYTTNIDLGYGQDFYLKVVDVNETHLTIGINQNAPNIDIVEQSIKYYLEITKLYKTSDS